MEWRFPAHLRLLNGGKIQASYAWEKVDTYEVFEPQLPANQFSLISYMDFPTGIEVDAILRYVDDIIELDYNIAGYTEVDLRIGWKPNDNLEISISGQNLANSSHVETQNIIFRVPTTEIERSVYGKATWRF